MQCRRIATIFLFSLMALSLSAQKHLTAMFDYATFCLEGHKPYLETYLNFDAWNLHFAASADGQYRAHVEVVYMVSHGDSTVHLKKYILNSPAIGDTTQTAFNFMDVQRVAVANGTYTVSLQLRDTLSNDAPVVMTQNVQVDYDRVKLQLSSIQLMSRVEPTTSDNILSRYGYDMEPYVNDFLPEQVKTLHCYYEIYNVNHLVFRQKFLTVAYIEERESGQRVDNLSQSAVQQGSSIVPVVTSFDISQLPSGNYNLVVEVRNKKNELLISGRVPFQRSNPSVATASPSTVGFSFAALITDENQLNDYLRALYPIASSAENEQAMALSRQIGKLKEKQTFLYTFWTARSPLNAEQKWNEYRKRIDYVIARFGYPRTPGYNTDRGRVYLQYGAPDYVRDEKNFVSALRLGSGTASQQAVSGEISNSLGHIHYLPYQLWRYNQLPGDDPTRVFIFWDQFRSGYYTLLNSNAKGEQIDPYWERRLSQLQLSDEDVGEVGEQFLRGY
ncbi:MAG: GWxTD domain-containing protein [Bacteroidales bacterium]|nr:GWxTD domain-containing protein [Bacteroidales bacterium]